jgi:hypothetical protein
LAAFAPAPENGWLYLCSEIQNFHDFFIWAENKFFEKIQKWLNSGNSLKIQNFL